MDEENLQEKHLEKRHYIVIVENGLSKFQESINNKHKEWYKLHSFTAVQSSSWTMYHWVMENQSCWYEYDESFLETWVSL